MRGPFTAGRAAKGDMFMTATLLPTGTGFTRAKSGSEHAHRPKARVQPSVQHTDLQAVAQHMYALMLRNIASDGFVFTDPTDPGRVSKAGCVIAALTYPGGAPGVDQDYVFNWVRDAAITITEVAAAEYPEGPDATVQPLIDYVNFARQCQQNASPTMAHACYTIDGQPRPWTEQADGPALQSVALLRAYPLLDGPSQQTAKQIISDNVGFLLSVYTEPTTNLWEEHLGYSFFARAAQLACLRAVTANTIGISVPPGTAEAIAWLESALGDHWNGEYYVSMLDPNASGGAGPVSVAPGYDPNIDIVEASVYCGVPCTDTRLLATAARLRGQWADPSSPAVYPINTADAQQGMGPMLGRYPGDTYDGDMADPILGGHPWALCTANFAELYYNLAREITRTGSAPFDALSQGFFDQVGVSADSSPADAAAALRRAGDAMLQAVIYHSDHLELSEQFDGTSGFEKSVRDLTWSYAAFLSAVRARNGRGVEG